METSSPSSQRHFIVDSDHHVIECSNHGDTCVNREPLYAYQHACTKKVTFPHLPASPEATVARARIVNGDLKLHSALGSSENFAVFAQTGCAPNLVATTALRKLMSFLPGGLLKATTEYNNSRPNSPQRSVVPSRSPSPHRDLFDFHTDSPPSFLQ